MSWYAPNEVSLSKMKVEKNKAVHIYPIFGAFEANYYNSCDMALFLLLG